MSTTPFAAPNYGYASPTSYNYFTSDPRKIASQQRQQLSNQGYALQNQFEQLANSQGYNPWEQSQIELTPQQKQNIVTGAGISAGQNTASAVEAAQRAANAAGGNPMAMAAYRARAAQQQGQLAGNAMTQAQVAAQQAGAQGAEQVGQARMGQQDIGNQLVEQNYGNMANATNQASNIGLSASQTPSTFDKIMGGIGGALSFLDEGDVTPGGKPAVVAERGPEKIVDVDAAKNAHVLGGKRKWSNTLHEKLGATHDLYMDDGGVTPSLYNLPHTADYNAMVSAAPDSGTTTVNSDGSLTYRAPENSAPNPNQNWWSRFRSQLSQSGNQQQPQRTSGSGTPPSMNSASTVGKLAGAALSFLDEGGVTGKAPWDHDMAEDAGNETAHTALPFLGKQGENGVFTKPTAVLLHHHEAVVPLGYRPHAKVRPSMAFLPAARPRALYGTRV